tara:strand:- start:3885 stop:4208 length:324 start_codon:yes stop_codon:yes gene_type:complete
MNYTVILYVIFTIILGGVDGFINKFNFKKNIIKKEHTMDKKVERCFHPVSIDNDKIIIKEAILNSVINVFLGTSISITMLTSYLSLLKIIHETDNTESIAIIKSGFF